MSSNYVKILSESAENSSCHGLAKISNGRNWLVKTLWILCVCASSSYCIFNLSQTLVDFFNYNVHTKVERHRLSSIEFPAVTICHKNLLNPLKLKKLAPDLYYKYLKSKNFSLNNIDISSTLNENFRLIETNFLLNFLENIDLILNTTYELEDFFIDCYFSFTKCTENHFERLIIPKLGSCFKFNSNKLFNTPIKSIYAGTNGGLSLVLKLINEDELNIIKSNGIQLYIHNFSSIPYNGFDLINVPGGFETNIAIIQEHVSKLSHPYSNCIHFSNSNRTNMYNITLSKFGKYQQKFCIFLCYYEFIKNFCGCYFVEIYGIKYSEACNISKMFECIDNYDELFEPEKCLHLCPEECESVRFYYQISQSHFPSRLTFDILNKKYPHLFNDYEKNKSNLLALNVYHDDISLKTIKDTPAKTVEQLVAEIGGFMGLCLGASFLTLVELADLLINLIFCCKQNKIEKIFPKK